jgi:hypothetical protein
MPGMTWTSQELLAGLEKAAGRRRAAAATWRVLAEAADTEARRQERLRWAEAEDRMGLLLEGQAIALAEEMAERTRT